MTSCVGVTNNSAHHQFGMYHHAAHHSHHHQAAAAAAAAAAYAHPYAHTYFASAAGAGPSTSAAALSAVGGGPPSASGPSSSSSGGSSTAVPSSGSPSASGYGATAVGGMGPSQQQQGGDEAPLRHIKSEYKSSSMQDQDGTSRQAGSRVPSTDAYSTAINQQQQQQHQHLVSQHQQSMDPSNKDQQSCKVMTAAMRGNHPAGASGSMDTMNPGSSGSMQQQQMAGLDNPSPLQQQQQQQQGSASDNEPVQTQYVSANCVVYTYHGGSEIGNLVDDHFSKALSISGDSSGGQSSKSSGMKSTVPMTQRSFPPSFWDSNYQPPPPPMALHSGSVSIGTNPGTSGTSGADYAAAAAAYSEFYHHAAAHHVHSAAAASALHPLHQTDPWNLSLSSQAYGHHRPMHDLSYAAGMSGATAAGRFNPTQYGFFMHPHHHQAAAAAAGPSTAAAAVAARTATGRTAAVPTAGGMGVSMSGSSSGGAGSSSSAVAGPSSGVRMGGFNHALSGMGAETAFGHPFGSFSGFDASAMQDPTAAAAAAASSKDLYWFQ